MNRYKRKQVLKKFYDILSPVCDAVYTRKRPTTKQSSGNFIVVRLPLGIDTTSSIHNTATVQLTLFVHDRSNGIVDEDMFESLCDAVLGALRANRANDVFRINDEPLIFNDKSDGMGYQYEIMQFDIVIPTLKH